ncbi:unnamed protein product, partial [Amoebophrya sp. A120]|eukprot:GSA120T00000934001.1
MQRLLAAFISAQANSTAAFGRSVLVRDQRMSEGGRVGRTRNVDQPAAAGSYTSSHLFSKNTVCLPNFSTHIPKTVGWLAKRDREAQ